MKIVLLSPYESNPEFKYMANYVFKHRLGLDFELVPCSGNCAELRFSEKKIRWRQEDWTKLIIPRHVFWDGGVPFFSQIEAPKLEQHELDYDFLYYGFIILSRFEECENVNLDQHKRFPLSQSFLYRLGMLEIPVVDVYVEYLRKWLERHLQVSCRSQSELKRQVTFDIDQPRNPAYDNWFKFTKACALGQIPIKPSLVGNSKHFYEDRFFTFPFLFSKLEARHHPLVFFIADRTHQLDGSYNLEDFCIREIFSLMKQKGIPSGCHGSYDSYKDNEQLKKQRALLQNVQDIRQHFLRFSIDQTWLAQEKAGFSRDWTLGFPEAPGFRAGTCHPFMPYSFSEKRMINILIEPLVLMDVSLTEKKYLGLSSATSMIERARPLFEMCSKYGGHFNVLFHNPTMLSSEVRKFYEVLLSW